MPSYLKQLENSDVQLVSTADLLVNYLHQLQVEKVFGIPGGALEPFSDALGRAEQYGQLQVVATRNESGAAYMAQAYGLAKNKIGVCFVTTGPGATNALTAVASAYAEEVPLLIISAQNSQAAVGRRPFQDSSSCGVDTMAIFSACTHYNARVEHPYQLERHLVNAVQHAFADIKGPVHLSLPGNVLAAETPLTKPSYKLHQLLNRKRGLPSEAIEHVVEMIASSSEVLFVLGDGVAKCGDQLLQLAQWVGARVVTTPAAKGLVDSAHPSYYGVCGFAGHRSAFDVVQQDNSLVILLGTALDEWDIAGSADQLFQNSDVIHIDEIERHLINSPMAGLHVHADIASTVDYLSSCLMWRQAETTSAKLPTVTGSKQTMAELQLNKSPAAEVHPGMLMKQISRHWPENSICFTDVGNSSAWAIHYLDRPAGREKNSCWYRTTTRFAAMGWGLGQAIGHAMANPQQRVICVLGDGAMLMNGQEISVAKEYGLNVLFVVLNDGAYGMVKHGQRLNQAQSVGNVLPEVDFSQLAHSQGVSSYRINNGVELMQLDWRTLFQIEGPMLLDVKIDGEVVPPIDVRTKMIKEGNAHE